MWLFPITQQRERANISGAPQCSSLTLAFPTAAAFLPVPLIKVPSCLLCLLLCFHEQGSAAGSKGLGTCDPLIKEHGQKMFSVSWRQHKEKDSTMADLSTLACVCTGQWLCGVRYLCVQVVKHWKRRVKLLCFERPNHFEAHMFCCTRWSCIPKWDLGPSRSGTRTWRESFSQMLVAEIHLERLWFLSLSARSSGFYTEWQGTRLQLWDPSRMSGVHLKAGAAGNSERCLGFLTL